MTVRSPKAVQGVLFDLDGVLIDSARAWYEVVRSGPGQLDELTFEDFAATFGQGPEADRRAYFPACSPEQVHSFYLEAFPRHLDAVELMHGARELLTELQEKQISSAVVTNTPRPLAEATLQAKGLAPLLGGLAAAGDAPEKPAPDLIQLALTQLRVPADGVIYVGDSESDRAAARAAGVFMLGLDAPGDATISHLAEVLERLAR